MLAAALMAACLALFVGAGSASALVRIDGNPMTVYIGSQGQIQSLLSGSVDRIYYAPFEELGDAGFFLAFPFESVYGFEGTAGPSLSEPEETEGLEPYEPIEQYDVTGNGSAADPFRQVTEYEASGVRVTQTTTYVNGTTDFKNKWVVKNETGGTVKFRAFAAADFYFEGNDFGTGVFSSGPPRFIGGTNADSGRSGGFLEVEDGLSPLWDHYQELSYPDVWTDVIQKAWDPDVGFNDTVNPEEVDNAGGVEWDTYNGKGLKNGASATFEVISRTGIPAALQLNPTNVGSPQGVPAYITATALDSSSVPYAGRLLRYSIAGVNPGAGSLTLNSAGQAVIADPGVNVGGDTISAFVDFNSDGVREPNEPQASTLATFVDTIAPSCRVKVKGDRNGGRGGAGNRIVITVKCNDTARIAVRTTLFPKRVRRHRSGRAKAHGSSGTASRRRGRAIKLPKTKATIPPGSAKAVRIKVPKPIARKYAGRKLKAKIVTIAQDSIGNVKRSRKWTKVRIAKLKPKKHRRHGRR